MNASYNLDFDFNSIEDFPLLISIPKPSIPFDSMALSGTVASLQCALRGLEASVFPSSSLSRRNAHAASAILSPSPFHVLACSSLGMHPVPAFPTPSPQINHLPNLGMISKRPSSLNVSATKDELQNVEVQENRVPSTNDIMSHGLLPEGLQPSSLPKHVAMVMDGHSRWAEKRGLPTEAGHREGITAVLPRIVELSSRWGIQALTVFAFSTENWSRPKKEVDFYMNTMELLLNEQLENWKRGNIQLHVMGDFSRLSKSLLGLITRAQDYTKHNFGMKLTIALSYGGREDILQACQHLARQVEVGKLKSIDITQLLFEKQLKTSCLESFGSPDLLIRTSGEQRLSNFLLWQMAYTELYFMDALWPEFDESLYVGALQSFQSRKRRFGKRIKN